MDNALLRAEMSPNPIPCFLSTKSRRLKLAMLRQRVVSMRQPPGAPSLFRSASRTRLGPTMTERLFLTGNSEGDYQRYDQHQKIALPCWSESDWSGESQ